ncbi:MAG: hypothetical protein LH630_06610 [Actinomycetia bacterium]|nr:hypothetical protein [Actinomycetes bacterium]
MDFLERALIVLHFIGLASLLGGFLVQIKVTPRVVNNAMVHGIITQLVTGVLLVGIAESGDAPVDHAKVGVKLAVAVVVAVLVFANRKRDVLTTGAWALIGGLTIADIVVAVYWR